MLAMDASGFIGSKTVQKIKFVQFIFLAIVNTDFHPLSLSASEIFLFPHFFATLQQKY